MSAHDFRASKVFANQYERKETIKYMNAGLR